MYTDDVVPFGNVYLLSTGLSGNVDRSGRGCVAFRGAVAGGAMCCDAGCFALPCAGGCSVSLRSSLTVDEQGDELLDCRDIWTAADGGRSCVG